MPALKYWFNASSLFITCSFIFSLAIGFIGIKPMISNKIFSAAIFCGAFLTLFGWFVTAKQTQELQNQTEQNTILVNKIDNLTNIILKQQEQYLKQQYDLQEAKGELMSPEPGRTAEPYRINFGTNIFINTPNILVADGIPLITMAVKNNRLLVSATIYDKDGKILCLIRDNEWVLENKFGLRKESTIDSLKVWDDKNRIILDVEAVSDRLIKLNGVFYKKGAEVIATDEGLKINSVGTSIGLGGR